MKALLVSAGMAMAAPVICSCIIRDWSAAAGKTHLLSTRAQQAHSALRKNSPYTTLRDARSGLENHMTDSLTGPVTHWIRDPRKATLPLLKNEDDNRRTKITKGSTKLHFKFKQQQQQSQITEQLRYARYFTKGFTYSPSSTPNNKPSS